MLKTVEQSNEASENPHFITRIIQRRYYLQKTYSWWVVLVLSAASLIGWLDRQVLNLLVEPIKHALNATDAQIGLLQGLAVAIFYLLVALPIGRLADRLNRRNIVIIGTICWTCATFASGLTAVFFSLFVARAFVGIGEATLTPCGFSIISDYFPADALARPLSVFTCASFVGSGAALFLGGAVLSFLNAANGLTMPIVGHVAPWQAAFMLVSLPGVLVLLLLPTIAEPPRRARVDGMAADTPKSLRDVYVFLAQNSRLFFCLLSGMALLAASSFALNAWVPSFFIRTFGWSSSQVGRDYGIVTMIFGTSGVLAGGYLTDKLAAYGYKSPNLIVIICSGLLSLPLSLLFPLVASDRLSFLLLIPLVFCSTMPFGAGPATIPVITPNGMRGLIVSLYLLVVTLIGALGPLFVGVITTYIFHDAASLRYALSIVILLLVAGGTGLLALAMTPYAQLFSHLQYMENKS